MFCHIDTTAPCVYQAHSPYLCIYIGVSASSVVCIERLEAYALVDVINSTNLPAVTREPSNNNETTYCLHMPKKN